MRKSIAISFLFGLFLLAPNYLLAQKIAEKAMAAYFKANEFGSRTQWEEGIVELQKAIKIQPDYTQAKELLGEYFYALKKYDDAIKILESCAADKAFSARSIYLLSEIYLKQNNTEKAKLYAEKYVQRNDKAPKAAAKAQQTILNADFAAEAKKHPVPFLPINLGDAINTSVNEYFPYLTPDGKIFLFTGMDGYQEDIYYALRSDTVFSQAMSFGKSINTPNNEGASTMNVQGDLLFTTACNRHDGYGSCDIYYSMKQNHQWTPIMGIGKPINSGDWEAQPSFSSDAKTLYFVSNRAGGFGGRDIWVSHLNEQMKWNEPQNLGPNINTPYDDQCPFIHADNKTLYFTSNGWPGMGKSDIFMSQLTDTGWTRAYNIGYPINTEEDENGLTVSFDGKTAFMASSRSGGLGGLDIYRFDLPENVKPTTVTYIKAIVQNAQTKQPIDATVTLIDLSSQKITKTSKTTHGSFFTSMEPNKNFALQIQKDGFLFYSQNINLKEITTQIKPYEMVVELEPILSNSKLVLNNVFFDFDKSTLQTESFVELDNLVDLLKKNPTVKIEISGHTDDKGDAVYNKNLSQKRAESVLNYLTQKGIAATRLIAKGYGETSPIAPNDTEENKAKNRRTEVKVL